MCLLPIEILLSAYGCLYRVVYHVGFGSSMVNKGLSIGGGRVNSFIYKCLCTRLSHVITIYTYTRTAECVAPLWLVEVGELTLVVCRLLSSCRHLGENQLSGSLPSELGGLTAMRSM